VEDLARERFQREQVSGACASGALPVRARLADAGLVVVRPDYFIVPLQAVVELLEDEGGEALEVGRKEVVKLAGVVAREGLEYPALIESRQDPPSHVDAVRSRCYAVLRS